MKNCILIIDDELPIRKMMSDSLSRDGMNDVDVAESGETAFDLIAERDYALAIVDLGLPGCSGLEVVRGIKEKNPDTEIIICTGQPTEESMLEALHEHVYDYLCKPIEMHTLARAVVRALERRQLVIENRELIQRLAEERDELRHEVSAAKKVFVRHMPQTNRLVGSSKALANVYEFIAEVAPSNMTVLIRGESGTGKDIVAHLIHEYSGRAPKAFSKINCPAIPESLIESELFGHEAGAFTGANKSKLGRFEMAPHGTVFLDEIGEISTTIQAKLLQVIEHKQFVRLGGTKTVNISTRIIAATNAPLEKMIQEGNFRGDLLFRLDQYSIVVPPLRERKEDIDLLVKHFLTKYGSANGHANIKLPPILLAHLCDYDWPGNVRELEALIGRFALKADPAVIEKFLAGKKFKRCSELSGEAREETQLLRGYLQDVSLISLPKSILQEREKETVLAALAQTRWNQKKAAKILGISYSSLRRRVAKYDLKMQPDNSGKYTPLSYIAPL